MARRPQLDLFHGPPAPGGGESSAPEKPRKQGGEGGELVAGPRILTVAELARKIRGTLEGDFRTVHVRGEISSLRTPGSGHHYFCLKEEGAQIRAVLFRGQARLLRFRPENGKEVIARGRVTFYEAGGDAQLVCDSLDPVGAGALALAFEQRKAKLAKEGLFDRERKKPVPFLPLRIGVVTSPTGAAIRDFLKVLHRRFPGIAVSIAASRVQGEGAAEEIARGIRKLDQGGFDVIVVTRGGGSIEDLWAFNEEVVARAIADAKTPVVSAVGHEVDFTIADFVADLRAPTPTAAAELLAPVEAELRERIAIARARLQRAAHRVLEQRRATARQLRVRLGDPRGLVEGMRLALDGKGQRSVHAMRRRLDRLRRAFHGQLERLRQQSPAARLQSKRRDWQRLWDRLARAGANLPRPRRTEIAALQRRLRSLDPRPRLHEERAKLMVLRERLARAVEGKAADERRAFDARKASLEALSPLGVLTRGYAIAFTPEGKALRSAAEVRPGVRLHLELGEGALEVEVVAPAPSRKS